MRIEIPGDSAFFAGHFPGHPILPGIAHLALVGQALGKQTRIAGIASLRLRSPVQPGDVLDLKLDGTAQDGTVRFDLQRGIERVSQGTLRLDPLEGEEPVPVDDLEEMLPVGSLIPHAPPARLVRGVLAWDQESLTGLAEIPSASPFVENARSPTFLGLEAAAQGAAVLEALSRTEPSGPRIGYLVGLRDVRLPAPWLPVDRPLHFTVRRTGSAPPLSIYEAVVEGAGGQELACGTISTYLAG